MLITRSKVSLEVKVMVANTETKTVEEITKVIPKVDEKKIQKELEKVLPENLKFVSTIESKEVEKLYGLDEAIFMDNAVELDPKTRKPIKTEAPKEDTPKTENK